MRGRRRARAPKCPSLEGEKALRMGGMARAKAAGAREWRTEGFGPASTQAWVVGVAALWLIVVLLPCLVPVSPVRQQSQKRGKR